MILHNKKVAFISAVLLLTSFMLTHQSKAQALDSALFTVPPDSIQVDTTIVDRIPPLSQLIDSAMVHSGVLQRQIKQGDVRRLENQGITQKWLKYINLFATTNYGVYDNFMSVQDQSVVGSTINTGTSFRWSVGLTLTGTPLFDFFNQPTLKKIKELETQQEEDLVVDLELQIKKTVIQQLNTTLSSYKVLIISNENVISNYTQLILSERLFYQGELEIFALANVREMYYKSLTSYEKAKYEFQMNYLILEAICGFQF
jgi:hypothetical protein